METSTQSYALITAFTRS